MKVITVLFLLFLLCWGLPDFPSAKEKVAIDFSEALRMIDIWLEAQREYDRLPSISAAIVNDQEILWSKGYGMADLEKKVNATQNTIYSICSISKLFTAVAIMQLRDAGKLKLEDHVSKILPWFNIQQQWDKSGPITIRSLLTHSSGLPRESDYPYWSGPDFAFPTPKQLRNKLGSQKTIYPASTYYQYSNLGFSLLGEIVAEVSGMSFEKYIQKNILSPLRLAETRTKLPRSLWRGKLATGYSSVKRDGTRDSLPFFLTKGITPAAGFSSTVQDLSRFAAWQFRLLKNGDKEILKASTLHEMYRVHWMDPDWKSSWGLGFAVYEVDGKTMVSHAGSCPGYRSILLIDPQKKQAFIVMINALGVSPHKYATGMREVLNKAMRTKIEKEPQKVDLEAYSGLYDAQPWGGERAVFPWRGKLAVFQLPSNNPAKHLRLLKYVKENVFRRIRRDNRPGEKVVFERNKSGQVVRMWQNSNFSNKIK